MTHEPRRDPAELELLPYLQLAAALAQKPRQGGGTMFRHQLDTLAVLFEYGHHDPVLLGAALVHDYLEDIPGADEGRLRALPRGDQVLALVHEVTRQADESKEAFLFRIRRYGSPRAKLLKVADRISNLVSLGLSRDPAFVRRYLLESALQVHPIAEEVDPRMAGELRRLLEERLGGR